MLGTEMNVTVHTAWNLPLYCLIMRKNIQHGTPYGPRCCPMNYVNCCIICTLLMFVFVQSGCSSKSMQVSKAEAKFDAPLRIKLNEAQEAQSVIPIQCIVKLNSALGEDNQKLFKDAGINVLAVVNEIITIEGPPDAIRSIAVHDFVHSISLSQTRFSNE